MQQVTLVGAQQPPLSQGFQRADQLRVTGGDQLVCGQDGVRGCDPQAAVVLDECGTACTTRGTAFPALQGKYIFGDIVQGRVFYTNESQMVRGGTALAPLYRLNIYNSSNQLVTMKTLAGDNRVDLRLGIDSAARLPDGQGQRQDLEGDRHPRHDPVGHVARPPVQGFCKVNAGAWCRPMPHARGRREWARAVESRGRPDG